MKTVKLLMASTVICLGLSGAPAQAQDVNEQAQFIGLMSQYLELSNQIVALTGTPEGAIFMAVEGIFEVYEERRDAPSAIKHLERILDDTRNQTVRNIVRLKLRDIYKETGQSDKALEQLDMIIKENAS